MPTGVTVADDGRIFVCYPRWGDPVTSPSPNCATARRSPIRARRSTSSTRRDPADCLVSVQSVVVDPPGRLWLLDTGATEFGPTIADGPKLVSVDLRSDQVMRTIRSPPTSRSRRPTSTTSASTCETAKPAWRSSPIPASSGPNGISSSTSPLDGAGASSRAIPAMLPVDGFVAIIEGRPLAGLAVGADGIAIGADGERLFVLPADEPPPLQRVGRRAGRRAARRRGGRRHASRTTARRAPPTGWSPTPTGGSTRRNYEQGAILVRQPDGEWQALVHRTDLRVRRHAVGRRRRPHLLHRQSAPPPSRACRAATTCASGPTRLMRTPVEGAPVRLGA